MTPRFRYPRFEENQVLSYQHLNLLTDFLEGEDRLSRRALIGAGVAYGLTLEHSTNQGLRLRRGAAITTDGSLCHLETDLLLVAARLYRDPVGYPPFHSGGGAETAQTELWELVEEAPADAAAATALTGAAAAAFLADKAALLFLETTTADLDTCIDNHCINQGQERRGVWRVLLGRRADLTAIRQAALGIAVPWPAWALDELRAERLLLQSADVLSHAALSTRALDFLRLSRARLLPAVQESVPLFGALLDVAPQTTADALNALSAGFDAWLSSMVSGDRVGWQHGQDHVRHLYRAWAEFVEAAFGFATEAPSLREPFPQHVLLGVVPTARYGEPNFLRHHFVPSPLLTLGGRDRELCRHRFLRLITLCTTFRVPASLGVRITPGAALDHLLDEQAVPFYYDPVAVLGCWNADATWRNRGRLLPCYHREALLNDPAARDPLRFASDAWEFYRIEGHQGRNGREVVRVLDEQRRRYHLAFDVVTVTFGPDELETTNCLCELEEIKTLYRVSADEMRCHIARLLGFLGRSVKPATVNASIFDKVVLADGKVNIGFDLQKVEFLDLGTVTSRAKTAATTETGGKAAPTSAASSAAASGAASAAAGAVVGQAEDLRTVYLDNLKISYPIIPSVLYSHLTPEVLVNSLARELMGRLTEADGRLGASIEEFNADQFSQTIQAARTKASDLADALTGLSTDVEPDVLKRRELLRQELLLFLANCVPTRIVQIATLFAHALERLRATQTLASFLRRHPGLEHQGGVPKGGTFVLVCGQPDTPPPLVRGSITASERAAVADRVAFSEEQSRQSLRTSEFANPLSESLLLKAYGYYQATPSTNRLVDQLITADLSAEDKTLLSGNYTPAPAAPGTVGLDLEAVYERLRDFFGVSTVEGQDIVLADFCLPYLCCSECVCTSTVVLPPPPASISLPATTFCATDPTAYPVTVSPEGGRLFVQGIEVTGRNFTPANYPGVDTVTLEYRIGDQSARLTVTLRPPPTVSARFEIGTPNADGSEVRFFATADDSTTIFTWRFPDGSSASGANVTRRFPAPGRYSVTLEAVRTPCTVVRVMIVDVPAANTPPTISGIPNTTIDANTSAGPFNITIGDIETPPQNLVLSATSDNPVLVPNSNLVLGGSGATRTLTVTPAPNQSGSATIQVTVSDGALTASTSFVLTVRPVAVIVRLRDTDATEFCADDTRAYAIVVSPAGGQLQFHFNGVPIPGAVSNIFTPSITGQPGEIQITYTLPDGRAAALTVILVAPPVPAFVVEKLDSSDRGTTVRFINNTQEVVESFFWKFDDEPEELINEVIFDRLLTERRIYRVILRATRGPCAGATVTHDVDLREQVQPPLIFDPGHLDNVLGDDLVRRNLGRQANELIDRVSALNARAAAATTDPISREELNTQAAEQEIGSTARLVFEQLAPVLLEQAGRVSVEIRERLWEFAQIPIAAAVYLAGLRTNDLTATGEIARAFSGLAELLASLRRAPHGTALALNDEATALLKATTANDAKPILQKLSRQTSTAFPQMPRRRMPAAKKVPTKPAKGSPSPAGRPTKRPRRRD